MIIRTYCKVDTLACTGKVFQSFFRLLIFESLSGFTVSNEIPEQPVVSPVSGAIFEKRLIEKYINENGCDPINSESLDVSQLIEIKGKRFLKAAVSFTSTTIIKFWDVSTLLSKK